MERASGGRVGSVRRRPEPIQYHVVLELCRPEFSKACGVFHQHASFGAKYADQANPRRAVVNGIAYAEVGCNEAVAPARAGKGSP